MKSDGAPLTHILHNQRNQSKSFDEKVAVLSEKGFVISILFESFAEFTKISRNMQEKRIQIRDSLFYVFESCPSLHFTRIILSPLSFTPFMNWVEKFDSGKH